ncbi:agmatine deiminase family protein [Sporolactobacillus shoreae]|uniref:Putative agmatine deiminase n=1 Tax=Sporolactobacillus shoreae TaxID=1465501 RepID=A0A4Z0GIJ9_9BACL|nr:agmatine deiminase family protein [Sporolactobacillus shoreae]TGA96582.1 agmatine deiminase family protein [Sporolactobacillus shoreae]
MFPAESGFRMPAEWAAHERTFISWPVRESMCYPEDYARVSAGYAEFARAVAEFEPVTVLVNPGESQKVGGLFENPDISILTVPHNDSWIRDNGPTFLTNCNGGRAGINWRFNAWGEKYSPWDLDDQAAPAILEHFHMRRFDAPIVLEGGSIHVDGEGTLLTTEQCLLNPNRNPRMGRGQIEEELKKFLNIQKVIWLKNGLSGDETDGHVDNIACFAMPGKVLIQVTDDPNDANFAVTRENLRILERATDAHGRKIEVIPVLQPPEREFEGERLTLSYLNFYLCNGGVILPIFGEETDLAAEKVISEAFPDRRIRTIDGMAIIKEGGNVHCSTQQMPAIHGSELA